MNNSDFKSLLTKAFNGFLVFLHINIIRHKLEVSTKKLKEELIKLSNFMNILLLGTGYVSSKIQKYWNDDSLKLITASNKEFNYIVK